MDECVKSLNVSKLVIEVKLNLDSYDSAAAASRALTEKIRLKASNIQ